MQLCWIGTCLSQSSVLLVKGLAVLRDFSQPFWSFCCFCFQFCFCYVLACCVVTFKWMTVITVLQFCVVICCSFLKFKKLLQGNHKCQTVGSRPARCSVWPALNLRTVCKFISKLAGKGLINLYADNLSVIGTMDFNSQTWITHSHSIDILPAHKGM